MEEKHNYETEESILGGIDVNIFKYDIKVLFVTLRRRIFFLVLLPLLTGTLAFFYVAYYKQKVWVARCMVFRDPNPTRIEGQSLTPQNPLDTRVIIEMVRTRHNMREVIRRLKLQSSIDSLYGQTEVQMAEDSESIINVYAASLDPHEAADIANTLAEVFVGEYIRMQNSSLQTTYDSYVRSRQNIMDKLQSLEKEQQDYLKRHNVISISTETDGKFKQLNELEISLLQAKMQETALAIRLRDLQRSLETMQPEVRLSYQVSTTDDTELERKRTELYQLQQKFTDQNPRIKKIKSEISYLEQRASSVQVQAKTPERITYGVSQVRSSMEEMLIRTETELNGVKENITQYNAAIEKLKADLGGLSKIENEYLNTRRNIDLKRDMLLEINKITSTLEFTLKARVSDIVIMERAEPPMAPSTRRRRVTIIMGAAAGFFLAFGLVLMSELIDFTIKSRFDLDSILRIRVLGSLPKLNQVNLQTFYSAVQVIYKNIFEVTDNGKEPALIVFGDVESQTGKSFFIKKCIDVFNPQEKKILYITTVEEISPSLRKYVINDYIYKDDDVDPSLALENNNRLYFLLDDYTYIAPADKHMVKRFVNKYTDAYDFVFWELFSFNKNEQLFVTVAEASALTVIMARFRKSGKFSLLKCVNFLREHDVGNIGGILNCVDKKYFEKGA